MTDNNQNEKQNKKSDQATSPKKKKSSKPKSKRPFPRETLKKAIEVPKKIVSIHGMPVHIKSNINPVENSENTILHS